MKKQNDRTIKAHFIRSALYVLLLLAVCVIPFALAQRNANNRSAPATNRNFNTATATPSTEAEQNQPTTGGPIAAQFIVPPFPKDPQVVLYDQYDNASVIGTLSATFTDFPTFSSDLADDFVVPTGQTWNVQSIDADGVYFNGSGPATNWNVRIYANSGVLPGAQVYATLNQPVTQVGTTFTVNLT